MKVRKRNGNEEDFSLTKILNAVKKANSSVEKEKRMDEEKINQIVEFVQKKIKNFSTVDVETIQDFVEKALMNKNCYEIAKAYVLYRNERKKDRLYTDDEMKIISICNSTNEDVSGDNANKRPTFLGTQRDYIAGTMCKSIGRKMLPKEVTKCHDEGSIHFHDMDYSPLMNMSNCCLVNTFDMFTNSFAMGDVLIEPAHSFSTACNHLAQIALHVSSSQYGGQTHSWTATVPFLQKSREAISKRIHRRCSSFLTEEQMNAFIEEDLKKEISRGVQTFQYQVLCHMSSNGQTPFVSMNLCLAEAMTEQEQKDLALIIEEVLRQRTQGIKDRKGRIISPLFPKLLYWICDGLNVEESDPYYYINVLASECEVKRMQPDILSEKKCREMKENLIIACMGACRGDEIVSVKINNVEYNNIRMDYAFDLIRKCNKHKALKNDKKSNLLTEFKDKCGVYKITHIPTGKYYIGSSKDIRRRLIEHRYSTLHYGKLGELYFINDFDTKNFKYEILEECNIDNLWIAESEYVDLNDPLCVNHKDPKNNGNFKKGTNNSVLAIEGKSYSTYQNKAYTWWEDVKDVYVKSRGEWEVVEKISYNEEGSPLKIYEVQFDRKGFIQTLHITEDHPLHTQRGRVVACELKEGDELYDSYTYEKYKIVSVKETEQKCKTYDFTTSNDMFDLSGIVSHNCRSFLTPYWTKKKYVEKDGKILKAELYSILNYGINWEVLDKPNDKYICRSLKPKSLKKLWEFECDRIEMSSSISGLHQYKDWEVVYNYLGNTARIQSVSYNSQTDEYTAEVIEPKTYGRWNQGVVTINLPYVALKSKQKNEDFYVTLDKYLEVCHKGLVERHKSIKRVKAENAPILWMDGGLARLNSQDNLDFMLENNVDFTTISLGYVGLYETCMCLIGKSNTTDEGIKLSKEILTYMNDKCAEWKEKDNIPYSIYGTPEESSTEKFAKALKKLAYGEIINGVTDHNYVCNSYHVNPNESISAFKKLKLEGEYLSLSKGGAVSYIECSNDVINNKKVILQLIRFMYENILYSEFNFSNQGYCYECGFEGKLDIIDINGKLLFQCPHCMNRNQKKLSFIGRLCGYLGEFTNSISENSCNAVQGRISDLRARVYHI